MQISREECPGAEWDAFAETHPECRLGHASAWSSVFSDTYGLKSHYLAARSASGSLEGILPLVVFKPRPGGRGRLVSLPYLDGAGILAHETATAEALSEAAMDLMTSGGFRGLEMRSYAFPSKPVTGAEIDLQQRVNLALPLETNVETQWNAFRAKVRNQARKAERDGLELLEGDPAKLLAAFYEPFRVNMRDLGSPVHAAGFFSSAARHFGDRLRFIVTCNGHRPAGGLVAIRFGQRVTVPWASTLRSERKHCPNNQIYWEAIKWAIEAGATEFDFGRSPREGGTYRFKKGWGAIEEPLDWRHFDSQGSARPPQSGPPSAVLERLSATWTRLPVPVASWLGPRIRGYFSN